MLQLLLLGHWIGASFAKGGQMRTRIPATIGALLLLCSCTRLPTPAEPGEQPGKRAQEERATGDTGEATSPSACESRSAPAGLPAEGLTLLFDPEPGPPRVLRELMQCEVQLDAALHGDAHKVTTRPARVVFDGDGDKAATGRISQQQLGFGARMVHSLCMVVRVTKPAQRDTYIFDRGKNQVSVIFGYEPEQFEYFVEGNKRKGGQPRAGTQIAAQLGRWQTLCYTVGADGPSRQMNGYLNGVRVVGPLQKSFEQRSSSGGVTIGASGRPRNYFAGEVGPVMWWDRELHPREVGQVHTWYRDARGFEGLP